MTSWKKVDCCFNAILKKLGNPPIRLVQSGEFYKITGARLGGFDGRCHPMRRIITVKRNREFVEIKDVLWHEIAHILFPSKPHWWIECFAQKLSGSPLAGHYTSKYCKSVKDVPSKAKLLDLARKSTARIKE